MFDFTNVAKRICKKIKNQHLLIKKLDNNTIFTAINQRCNG